MDHQVSKPIVEFYDKVILNATDPRLKEWPLMYEPWNLLAIIAIYLYAIYIFLPNYMAYRKPYSLKTVIAAYNIYQIIACSILIYGVASSGWSEYPLIGCVSTDYSNNPRAVRMAKFVWWHMMLKMSELVETVFFVLRKKFNQVSPLHVYHHVSTLVIGWLAAKYFAGGTVTFTILMNSSVHIIMYTYYYLSALGPEWQKRLAVIKPKITAIQLIQLITILFHTLQVFLPGCEISNVAGFIYLPNLVINIYMFIQFYAKTYLNKNKEL